MEKVLINEIVAAMKTDDLDKLKKDLADNSIDTLTRMIYLSLDKFGNNLWTLAAENGTDKVMNYLVKILYSWETEEVDHVLHYQTCHKENACMDIVDAVKNKIVDLLDKAILEIKNLELKKLQDDLESLKQHLDPLHTVTFKTLKTLLGAIITNLDKHIFKFKTFRKRRTGRQLSRILSNRRKELIFIENKWHHNNQQVHHEFEGVNVRSEAGDNFWEILDKVIANIQEIFDKVSNHCLKLEKCLQTLEQHLALKPLILQDYLKTLKTLLDTTIFKLDTIIELPSSQVNGLKRILRALRTRLLLSDLEWHHNSLIGIVSKSYPSTCIIVQILIDLEIICHEKLLPKPISKKSNTKNANRNDSNISICIPKEDENGMELLVRPSRNSKENDDQTSQGRVLEEKLSDTTKHLLASNLEETKEQSRQQDISDEENDKAKEKAELLPKEIEEEEKKAFLRCMYNRVGKSPCTVDAIDRAGETYPSAIMPKLECSSFLALLYFLLKSKAFWICFIPFIFKFGLLVLDVSTDVMLVWELKQNYTQSTSHSCLRNITEINKKEFQTIGAWLFGGLSQQFFENYLESVFWATLLAVILPFVGYFGLWVIDDNLGFSALKKEVMCVQAFKIWHSSHCKRREYGGSKFN